MSCHQCYEGSARRRYLKPSTQVRYGGWPEGTLVRCDGCGTFWRAWMDRNEYGMHRLPRLLVFLTRRGALKHGKSYV